MLLSVKKAQEFLRCPRSFNCIRRCGEYFVSDDRRGGVLRYHASQDKPVLIDFDTSVLDEQRFLSTRGGSPVIRAGRMALVIRRILQGESRITVRNIASMLKHAPTSSTKPVILIVGGGTIGQGMDELYQSERVDLLAFDIYNSPHIQFVADAHRLPLADCSLDMVVIQAVLEHVLEPEKVVKEIFRVLKPGGIVYAETPFMQQVHEGPFDFMRFSDSGHRWLFRDFNRLSSGAVLGPAVQLIWSLDYFARGLFRSRSAGRVVRAAFSWLRFFDLLIPPPHQVDGACGVYFMGIKGARAITSREAITEYQGVQQ